MHSLERKSYVPRPPLAFRVGVTGTRRPPPGEVERLRAEIAAALAFVRDEVAALARDERAAAFYAPAAEGDAPFRLVSTLAEGAARLAAEEALAAGYALHAALPFPQAVYEQDFPATVDAFRALLARAETLELDGAHGPFASESCREAGRFIVRNCDLLIAVWDGERESGPGGVAEIVRFAAHFRVPVWRIDPLGRDAPGLIETPAQLCGGALQGAAARERLAACLKPLVIPPQAPALERGGVYGLIASLLAKRTDPFDDYLDERPLPPSRLWGAFSWLMDRLAPAPDRAIPPLAPAATRAGDWWERFRLPADELSIGYGDRYRSSYVWIALLAFIALLGGAASLIAPHEAEKSLIGVELAALLAITALVVLNRARRWHERWIAYRLLAELCRKQYVLSALGRTLPATEAFRASQRDPGLPRDAWVAWVFAAAQRAAPFPLGSLAAAKPAARALALSLVAEQTAYHAVRETRNAAASKAIARAGERFFFLATIFGAAKLGALFIEGGKALHPWFAAAGACVSAASGAFVGLRAFSEFSLIARQSAHMRRVMEATEAEFVAIDPDEPLASRDLGRALYGLSLSMLQDVGGWAQLFRIKSLAGGG